uniref:Uncharacterized protein n=1 Tax=Steinernema glaseri TaxID=37863 RepID=A0A1I7YEK6_9BILA
MTEVEETEPPVLIVLLRQQLTARRTGESEGSDYERSRERCEGARTCIIQCADGGNGEEGQRHSRGRRWCSEEGTTKQRTGSHAAGQTVLGGGQNALFVFAAFKTVLERRKHSRALKNRGDWLATREKTDHRTGPRRRTGVATVPAGFLERRSSKGRPDPGDWMWFPPRRLRRAVPELITRKGEARPQARSASIWRGESKQSDARPLFGVYQWGTSLRPRAPRSEGGSRVRIKFV